MMADYGLPDPVRVVGYHVATHDHGSGVELRLEDASRLLHGWPGDDKVRTVLRVLALSPYVSRTPGGRGHGDLFRWTGADRVGSEPHPNGADRVGLQPHPNLAWGQDPTLNTDSMGVQPQAKAPPPPPYTSSSSSVDARAREAMDREDDLNGLRGALSDYLRLGRVDNHHAYVMTVLGWIQGTDPSVWFDPRSNRTLTSDRQAVIAGCLNELAGGDEIGKYFPAPPGDVANLRAKIRYKARSILGAKRDAELNARAATGTDGAPARHPTRTPIVEG